MAELTINAALNQAYGSVEINNKYTPLTGINLANSDLENARKVMQKRVDVLLSGGMFPKKLTLYAGNWPAINVNAPPVVVISSNRAEWMKAKLDAETAAGATGFLDGTTLNNDLFLWYSPRRLPAASRRRVFICVHMSEYPYYSATLTADPNITIVGWKVQTANTTGEVMDVVGFGASRLAALELVKSLGYAKAWIVDDNVANINGFPNLLSDLEGNLGDDIWGIGFTAATVLKSVDDLFTDATFGAKTFKFVEAGPGLLQQAVLWNVGLLKAANYTFSPCFVMSNEDVSFCNWLTKNNKKLRVITALSIVKIAASTDQHNPGAASVEKRRKRMLQLFAAYENNLSVAGSPAAIPLPQFVSNSVLNLPTARGQQADVVQCRCAEQVMSAALEKWAEPKTMFGPYDSSTSVVRRIV